MAHAFVTVNGNVGEQGRLSGAGRVPVTVTVKVLAEVTELQSTVLVDEVKVIAVAGPEGL